MAKVSIQRTETSAKLWPPQDCHGCGRLTINAIRINEADVPYCHCCVLERDILASAIATPVSALNKRDA